MNRDPKEIRPWEVLMAKTALETPWFKIIHQRMRTPSGAETDYYIHDTHDSVICVCVSPGKKVLIEYQYRPPVEKISIDYPSGKVEKDDTSAQAAILRELREEVGFEAETIERLAVVDLNPGFSKTSLQIFLAQGEIKSLPSLEETEDIVAEFVNAQEVLEMIAEGRMACTFCVSATYFAFRKLGWLKSDL